MQSSAIETQQEHTARTSYQGHRWRSLNEYWLPRPEPRLVLNHCIIHVGTNYYFFTSSCSRVRSRHLVRRTGADESNPVRLFPIRILQESTKDLTTRLWKANVSFSNNVDWEDVGDLQKGMTSNHTQKALQTFSPTFNNFVRESVGEDFAW